MTAPAAIAGSFAEFRMVKTRSVCVLSIEIPVEQADAALKALGGVPQPGRERPVAVALLNPSVGHVNSVIPCHRRSHCSWPACRPDCDGRPGAEILSGPSPAVPPAAAPAPEPQTPAKETDGRRSSQDKVVQRCVLLCKEPSFHRWFLRKAGYLCSTEEAPDFVAVVLRDWLGIKSRRDLAIDNAARDRWLALEEQYMTDTGQRPWRRPDDRRSA